MNSIRKLKYGMDSLEILLETNETGLIVPSWIEYTAFLAGLPNLLRRALMCLAQIQMVQPPSNNGCQLKVGEAPSA